VTALIVVETVLLALVVLLVAGLLRSHAELLRRLDQLDGERRSPQAGRASTPTDPPPAPDRPPGARAADVVGSTLDGDAVKVAVAGGGRDTLVAFLSSGCRTCQGFWEALAPERRGDVPGDPRIVVVTKDGSHESPTRLRELAPTDIPVVMSSSAWDAYEVPVSPYFVYVEGGSGAIEGEGAAERWDQIVSLLRDARDDRATGAARPAATGNGTGLAETGGRGRILRADLELRAADIGPDHPSLYAPDDPARPHAGGTG
jgi:hypothetical protein